MATDVGQFDIVDDDLSTVLFQLNNHAGASTNPGSVGTLVRDLHLGTPPNEYVRTAPLHRPGGRTIRLRPPLTPMSWRQRIFSSPSGSFANLRLGVGRLAQLLERGCTIRWITPDSQTLYLDVEPADAPALIDGAPEDLFHALTLYDYPLGVQIDVLRQPYIRLPLVSSDTNLLGNPTLTIDVARNGTPDMWGWDNLGSISAHTIDAANEAYRFTIATTATRNLRQRTANFAQNDVCAFKCFRIKASAAGIVRVRAVIEYLNSSDGVVGTETASSQVSVGTNWTTVSVTKGAAGSGTVRARVSVRFENQSATSVDVYVTNLQAEKAASSTEFVCSTQRIYNDPSSVVWPHVNQDDFAVALAGVGAGNVNTGTHDYAITFVTEDGESSIAQSGIFGSWPTVTTTSGNGQVDITDIPLGGAGVIARRIYRSAVGTSTPLLLLTTLFGNETTFRDNVADASLGAAGPATSTMYLPGKVLPIHNHGDAETPLICSADVERDVLGAELWLARRGREEVGDRSLTDYMNTRKLLRGAEGTTLENNTTVQNETGASAYPSGQTAETTGSGETDVDDPNAPISRGFRRVTWTLSTLLGALAGGDFDLLCRHNGGKHLYQARWGYGTVQPQVALPAVLTEALGTIAGARMQWLRMGRLRIEDQALTGLVFQFWSRRDIATRNVDLDFFFFWPAESAIRLYIPTSAPTLWLGTDLIVQAGSVTTLGTDVEVTSGDTVSTTPTGGTRYPAGRIRFTAHMRSSLITTSVTPTLRIRNVTDSGDVATTAVAIRGAGVLTVETEVTAAQGVGGATPKNFRADVLGPSSSGAWVERVTSEFIPYVTTGERFYADTERERFERQLASTGGIKSLLGADGAGITALSGYGLLVVGFFEAATYGGGSLESANPTRSSDVIARSVLFRHSFYPRFYG